MTGDVSYLCNAPDVLFSVLGRESKILVQAEADIVTVQPVASQTLLEQMLLERDRNRRLARCRQTREPDGAPLLLTELAALLAREAGVPCDVAVLLHQHVRGVV